MTMSDRSFDPFVIALAEAATEIEEEYGIKDDEFCHALIEAMIASPRFSWIRGNIWHDVDESVVN